MKTKFILSLTFFLHSLFSFCQLQCFFEHFGPENGLPQHTVMDILQDKKGFIWFSTWNGLCKFDGYNFYTYKILEGNESYVRSNRIDFICEDKYGNIWTLPYNKEPYRFDPKTEKFTGLRSIKGYDNFLFPAIHIISQKSGKVWLLSEQTGCVCIPDSSFNIEPYSITNNKILGSKVFHVYEDSDFNSWILTNNGLYNAPADNSGIKTYFAEKRYTEVKATQHFYSAVELKNEIWFGSDNGKIWIYDKKDKQFRLLNIQTEANITGLKEISENRLLISSDNDGFFIYNTTLRKGKKYNILNTPNMCSNKVISSYIDKSERIWFELDCTGAVRFDLKTETLKHYKMNVEKVISDIYPPNFFIIEDIENRIWIHTRGGGFGYYDEKKDELTPFYNDPNASQWRFSNMMHTGFSDKQGNLWLSTRSHGLEKIVFSKNIFQSTVVDANINSTISNTIRSIFEDHNQNLWISTKGEKIFVFDHQHTKKGYVTQDGSISHTGKPLKGISYCIIEDNKQNIWIGTRGDGLYRLTPKVGKNNYEIKQYKHSISDPYSLSNDNIYSIFQDSKNRIWIGTYGGGINLIDNEENGRFFNCKNLMKKYPNEVSSQVRIITNDKHGNIYVGTTLGLVVFPSDFKKVKDIEYKLFTKQSNGCGLLANDIYDICTTKDGETYIATFGGGISIVDKVNDKGIPLNFKSIATTNDLPSDVVVSMAEDMQGKLWITTESNLTKYDPVKKSFITYNEISRLIDVNNISEGAKYASKSGLVYFGYSKGLITINPDAIESNSFKPYIALTRLQIANKDVLIGDDSPLKNSLDYVDRIKLNYKQNFISIEFAALDYVDPKRINYAYKLENFDQNWILSPNKQRTANYTNLAPGKYIFKVKSTNSDGVWLNNERSLIIEITPAFWQTGWAYLIYIILTVTLVYIVFRTVFTFYRLKDKIHLEQQETEMKTRFFTDVSHEIRTPLTMIVSPIENIIDDEETSENVKYQLQMVLKNANRILRMVNQVLDFRKIQKKKLNIQETKIGSFIEDLCYSFKEMAEQKNIEFIINNESREQTLWVDRDSIEKLIFNLLSNAFKHTANNKTIVVNIKSQVNSISIQVADEGSGMNKDVLNKIFTRFSSFNNDKKQPSTGIGLSIVKEVADKHHAKIAIESEVNSGSSFTVTFPKGIEHFKDNLNITVEQNDNNKNENDIELVTESDDLSPIENKQSILIVEDNNDLRQFIKTMLSTHYDVLHATNGKEGYDIATEKIPDFIISDIMMPEMDGIEFLKKIRSTEDTSHIPFIFLTAKSSIESKLEGLEYGADDYITKPFSVKYLKARISNIMQQRQLLYNTGINLSKTTNEKGIPEYDNNIKITYADQVFLTKVDEEIKNNIENHDFTVEDLIGKMAMSRSVFVKKLKSITGSTPLDLIRNMRINHAADLIDTGEYTIKEVAFMVGISDTKYFTSVFKKIYGMTPSEYKNRTKN